MRAEFVLAPEAEEDITAAYTWYEARRPGLGEDFLSALEAVFERIRRQPEAYALIHGVYHRALLRRFPYAVFYEQDDGVIVYGVLHSSRDPHHWRERML
jgi:plasmid stabilization system protein ParE